MTFPTLKLMFELKEISCRRLTQGNRSPGKGSVSRDSNAHYRGKNYRALTNFNTR